MKLVGLWAIGFLASLLQTLSDRFAVTSEESESVATSLLQTELQRLRSPKFATRADVCTDTVPVTGSARGLPAIGYIACCSPEDVKPANVRPGVARYLAAGGRRVVTAPCYGNEHAVGQGLRDSGVPREHIWVTTALDPPDEALQNPRHWAAGQVDASLHRLNVSYVDDMYLHWGLENEYKTKISLANVTKEQYVELGEQYLELYRGLIDAQRAGKVRHIGVGVHTQKEIEYLMNATGVKPDIMHGWITPFMPEKQLSFAKWAMNQGMTLSAWGPYNWDSLDEPAELESHRSITSELAKKYGATASQIVARWYLDKGIAMCTSMLEPSYVKDDLHCLRSSLSAEDTALLESVKWDCQKTDFFQPLPGCSED
ncbi:dkgA [Symbiodinium natans]|uniref:DkgA protein n=1 Tax=Symbiodinium natans TaxID=878477 RepID=A0A812I426_9DINO|nr:dkgA [Symbiodinium natans]